MSQTVTAIELTTNASAPKTTNIPDLRADDVEHDGPTLKKGSTVAVFASVTGVTGISSMLAGLVTVLIPSMARDLNIPASLIFWPASIYALTCGCSLILSGAIADVIGSRPMYLIGCVLQTAFTLACGLAQTPFQLIFFRALAGVAIAFCLPSAVSLITTYFPHGGRRNMAFAAMGGGQPVGFGIGLVAGGLLADSSLTWRGGFYLAAGLNTLFFFVTLFGLPIVPRSEPITWNRLITSVDWTGALLLSASLGLLSYCLAALTGDITNIHNPATIATLSVALALLPAFVVWVGRQERLGKPAIIPNSLWRNKIFTTVCIANFLMWSAFNATELLLTLFFQEVQMLKPTQASIRFLPAPIVGFIVNIMMGIIIHRVRADWAVVVATLISCVSPILTAVMKPQDSYWEFVFPSIALNALGPDVLFTASNLVITDAFPDRTQALAGGVFNTVAQIGKSVGLALSAVIANSISMRHEHDGQSEAMVLLEGYRGAWWFVLSITIVTMFVSAWGLRNVGRLGLKRE